MERGRRKSRTGRVLSNKMDKTVVVAVEWRKTHPLYKKSVRQTTKYYAHDENNGCSVGDVVTITETRPLSRTKRWRVSQIVTSGNISQTTEIMDLPSRETAGGSQDKTPNTESEQVEEKE